MSKNDPRKWNEEQIWESILDPNRIMQHEYNADIFKRWEDKYDINKEEYAEMYDAQSAIERGDWDDMELNQFSKERIENLENILKRKNTHPKQKQVAKILRDRLIDRINRERHGAVGWAVTADAIGKGDIDPKSLK